MNKIFKIIALLLCCFIAFAVFMYIKTEKDFEMRHKQLRYGEKKAKHMEYCNNRARIGIEDYANCMYRMSETDN